MRRLIIRPGAIGDVILSLPALECLRAPYTEIWARSEVLPLLGWADRVCSIASTGLDLVGLPGVEPPGPLWERLRTFDSIVSWYGTGREQFRRAVAELPFVFFPPLPPANGRVHAADFFLAQARTLSDRRLEPIPRIRCPRLGGNYAVIHPFSGSVTKNWPLSRFRELAQWLETRMPVQWCAGPNENWTVQEGSWGVASVRMENLYELAGWLAGARIYVGNDSGITHLAAAAGAPTVAIFGPTDPRVWGPRGPNVRIVATARPGTPIEAVTVEQVLAAVDEALASGCG
ncbi:MAG: glycosyltransferase family 9 protein [Bryobacterales bacterium]|nr:glycosyltransferase family 9 protein [Bryobacteraceae bacterium]MDW8353422.1 glycosyltransferase family 9 protein [Bryobacterales bacterium]